MKNILLYLHDLKISRIKNNSLRRIKKMILNSVPEKKYQKYLVEKLEGFFENNFENDFNRPNFLYHDFDWSAKLVLSVSWIGISMKEVWSENEEFSEKLLIKWLTEEIYAKTTDDCASLIDFLRNTSEQDTVPILEIISANRMIFRFILGNYCELNFANDKKKLANSKVVCLKDYKEGKECQK